MKSIDTIRLRKFVGWLGFSLAWIVLGLFLIFNCMPGYIFPDSISATYYFAPTITPFMGILVSASILLMCYRGYDKTDDIINTLTGIAGLCICLFPCSNTDMVAMGIIPKYVGTFQLPVALSGWLHSISAILFFALLAYNVMFLFTKSSGEITENKKKRNLIYKICGIGMICAMLILIFVCIFDIWAGTWAVEAVALAFFGIAFLTKADVYPWLFCDSKDEDKETDNA
jgi:hypothetical protein